MYPQHVISLLQGKSNKNVIYIKCDCGIVYSYIPGSSIRHLLTQLLQFNFVLYHTCIFTTRLLSILARSQLDDDIIRPKKSSFITIPTLRSTFYLRVKSNQNVCIRCDHGIVYSYIPSSRAFRGSDVYPLKYCSSILHYITPVFSCVFVTKICRWCQHARSR